MDTVTTEIHVLVSGVGYHFNEQQINQIMHCLERAYDCLYSLSEMLISALEQFERSMVDLARNISYALEPIVKRYCKEEEEVVFVPSVFEHYFDTYHKFFGYKLVTPRPLKYTPYLARRY